MWHLIFIAEVGLGVGFYVDRAQDGKEYIDPRYTTYSEYKWSSNKFNKKKSMKKVDYG